MNTDEAKKKGFFKKFPGLFWLVVMFEFFERGSYYGMMSFLSVYFVDFLHFPRGNVGVIKGVIQPLLYFLPIIAGAIADRFGYRRVLMVAFALLGGGYFLTSSMSTYSGVFMALVVMGFGAGTFKPIISGTIARITDESNSTQAFGIYYWSINLGAFLFPLFLVPFLKSMNPAYVILASGICTAMMIIPTALFFKEPWRQARAEEKAREREKTSLLQTLANAFEIIYAPLVLLYNAMKKSILWRAVVIVILLVLLGYGIVDYFNRPAAQEKFATLGVEKGKTTLLFSVHRNMSGRMPAYDLGIREDGAVANLTIFKPQYLDTFSTELLARLKKTPALRTLTLGEITDLIRKSDRKIGLIMEINPGELADFRIMKLSDQQYLVFLKDTRHYGEYKENLVKEMHTLYPELRGINVADCDRLHAGLKGRPFFLFFVISLLIIGLIIAATSLYRRQKETASASSGRFRFSMLLVPAIIVLVWYLPGLSMLGRIICSVIYFSLLSLFMIDRTDTARFVDHSKFLLMIVLYSGFWILYFQMFDSVLWYVQAYVDASALNKVVNGFLGIFGIKANWFFDVEHVTVINAGTIILLQLLISSIVKNMKALPTMIIGITLGTIGMAILSISTSIWVFMAGMFIFSIGEMTAHPKFISYVGLTAPTDRKALYMGYIFLYGVFGSSVGSIVGARLYIHFVDNLNQPRILWLIFSGIGVLTVISLLLYNKFLAPKKSDPLPR